MICIVGPAEEDPTEGGDWEIVDGIAEADAKAKERAHRLVKAQVVYKLVEMSYFGPRLKGVSK